MAPDAKTHVHGKLASRTCVVSCTSWSTRAHSSDNGPITIFGMVFGICSLISKTMTAPSNDSRPGGVGRWKVAQIQTIVSAATAAVAASHDGVGDRCGCPRRAALRTERIMESCSPASAGGTLRKERPRASVRRAKRSNSGSAAIFCRSDSGNGLPASIAVEILNFANHDFIDLLLLRSTLTEGAWLPIQSPACCAPGKAGL